MAESRDVCVVTDSTADIPKAVQEELGIKVIPLCFTIDGESFVDGDITLAEFFRRMNASKELPKTSAPAVGVFAEAFEECLQRCREVVCINISGGLSGTIESAREAARSLGDRVHVLDSLNLSWGEGFQVVAAAKAAAAGASLAEVKHAFEQARERMHMIVGLDTLENLAKGGRIGKVSALFGGMLNLKVIFTVGQEGTFEPVARARGAKAAMQASVDWLAEQVSSTKRAAFGILHAESPDKAEWLEAAVRARFNVAELAVIETGPVIATHTGTGWGLTGVELD
ncbi:MAG: DegV family protein [Actinobacteria bacterium]|nr:DegV family protein [Actinomycetota bacterium]